MKNYAFVGRSRPGRAGALARAGLIGITAGLVLAGGTAAGASAATVRAAQVSATPVPPVKPVKPAKSAKPATLGAPGNVIAQPGRTRMIVMWTAPTASGGAKVGGYLVYVGTRPGGEPGTPVTRAPIPETACAVMGLASTTTYYFKVAAVDAAGHRGPLSAEVSGVPWPAVTAPVTGPGTAGPGQVVPAPGQPSPVPATPDVTVTQDHPAPGAPAWLIIALAGVAAAALTGAVGLTLHLRRLRIGQDMPEALEPDELSGPRYR